MLPIQTLKECYKDLPLHANLFAKLVFNIPFGKIPVEKREILSDFLQKMGEVDRFLLEIEQKKRKTSEKRKKKS